MMRASLYLIVAILFAMVLSNAPAFAQETGEKDVDPSKVVLPTDPDARAKAPPKSHIGSEPGEAPPKEAKQHHRRHARRHKPSQASHQAKRKHRH